MAKLFKIPKRSGSLMLALGRRKLFCWMSDEEYLKRVYKLRTGKDLNLDAPVTFNEKLQWLKIHYRLPEMILEVDKYAVKDYVAKTLGEQYVIPTLLSWEKVSDIDFSELPKQFVLKCSHDSGGIVICRDKDALDISHAKAKLRKCMRQNAFWFGREWPYKNVKRRIIAEQYMEDAEGKGELTDYKLHFFSGECKIVMVGQSRFCADGLANDFYTPEWEHFELSRGKSRNATQLSQKPEQLDEMLRLGKILAKDYPFVRIDFYVINNRVYFGEITFYPASGFSPFHPDKWDEVFGEWIKLPEAAAGEERK